MPFSLAPRLRAADVAELAANGREPLEGLRRCLDLSALAKAIVAPGGRPIALFGFAPIDDETAAPWMLGSEDLTTTHRRWLVRNTQTIVRSGDHRWRRFFNFVDARNTVHVRWLRWAGFEVGPEQPNGPLGLLFHPFSRSSAPCVMSPPPSSAAARSSGP